MANLMRMRFGRFVFPVNPAELSVIHEGRDAETVTPLGGSYAYFGRKRVRVDGSGYFTGEDAMGTYLRLEGMFGMEETLILPGLPPMEAVLNGLTLLGVQDRDVVRYAFEFTECTPHARSSAGTVLTAAGGESLWDIADAAGVPIDRLLAANPRLPCVTELSAGDRVVLP